MQMQPGRHWDELKASAKHNNQGMSGSRKKRALEPASAFISTNPSFTVKMHPSYLTCADLNIPYPFAMRYFFKEYGKLTLRVSDGRTWIVDYYRKAFPSSEDCGKGSCDSGTSCGNATFCSSGTSCGSVTIFCKSCGSGASACTSCGSGASACTSCGEAGLKSWLESEFAACVGAGIEVDGRVDSTEECLSRTTRVGLA
ncbi:hypothetical protein COLO4_25281 [Corchorus olitorius]|uniref:Uncharacterized protein n=1 Tax=Corchorus olitorius TaxID=93759 RepID=A0A1R3I3N5_9ROSI|nr:hypothetical protein COLO4_25281 [Corchorus olitorius]